MPGLMQRCGSSWLHLTVLYKGGHAREAPLKIQSLEKNIQEVSAIYALSISFNYIPKMEGDVKSSHSLAPR